MGKYLYGIYVVLFIGYHILRFRPNLTVSLESPYLILASRLLGIKTIGFSDTNINPRLHPVTRRTDYLFTPSSYGLHFHKNHFRVPTFKELSYMKHEAPENFSENRGVFFRFTRTDTIHHTTESRFDPSVVVDYIRKNGPWDPCFVSSEVKEGSLDHLPDWVSEPDTIRIHNDLLRCRVFWGNSGTMAAEAAVSGIPAIFVGSEIFSYIRELEEYGLLFCYHPRQLQESLEKLNELTGEKHSVERFSRARKRLLNEKVDISKCLGWFIPNLPESAAILRNDPGFCRKFRP